jgi:hypothetical protein
MITAEQKQRSNLVLIITAAVFGSAFLIGSLSGGSRYEPKTETAVSEPDRVRAAVASQYSCKQTPSRTQHIGRDSTGSGYMVTCAGRIYWVLVDPEGRMDVSLTKW